MASDKQTIGPTLDELKVLCKCLADKLKRILSFESICFPQNVRTSHFAKKATVTEIDFSVARFLDVYEILRC